MVLHHQPLSAARDMCYTGTVYQQIDGAVSTLLHGELPVLPRDATGDRSFSLTGFAYFWRTGNLALCAGVGSNIAASFLATDDPRDALASTYLLAYTGRDASIQAYGLALEFAGEYDASLGTYSWHAEFQYASSAASLSLPYSSTNADAYVNPVGLAARGDRTTHGSHPVTTDMTGLSVVPRLYLGASHTYDDLNCAFSLAYRPASSFARQVYTLTP